MPEEYDEESGDPGRATSIWPHVEEHVVDLIEQHRSTIVFANSRRLAERLTARLNEIATQRAALVRAGLGRARPHQPAGTTAGPDHGPVRREQRRRDDHRQGPPRLGVQGAARDHRGRPQARTPARVVATSSLELGIDMGAVDLVIQIESPPSVASALQRVGRAGHQVGEVSRGVLFPKHRGDLAQTAVSVAAHARAAPSRSSMCRPTRSTSSPSRSWPRRPWRTGRSTSSSS